MGVGVGSTGGPASIESIGAGDTKSTAAVDADQFIIVDSEDGNKTKLIAKSNVACAGTGDVTGPASSTNNNVVLWNGTGGDAIKDSSIQSAWIDQDVSSGSSPTLDGTNFSGIVMSKSFFLEDPVAADDLPIIRVDAASTITKVVYAISGGTNWIGQIQEADDAQGTNAANTQAADSTVTGNTTVTSFSNAGLDAGDYIYLKTTSVSGAVAWLHVTVYFTKDA